MPSTQFDPLQNVEIVLPVFKKSVPVAAPGFGKQTDNPLSNPPSMISTSSSSLNNSPWEDLIVLDHSLTLIIIQKLLLPYTNAPGLPMSSSSYGSGMTNN